MSALDKNVAWERALSGAAGLRPEDLAATSGALEAVRAERRRQAARRTLAGRLTAVTLAVALAGALALRPQPLEANEAYEAYREANAGW